MGLTNSTIKEESFPKIKYNWCALKFNVFQKYTLPRILHIPIFPPGQLSGRWWVVELQEHHVLKSVLRFLQNPEKWMNFSQMICKTEILCPRSSSAQARGCEDMSLHCLVSCVKCTLSTTHSCSSTFKCDCRLVT